MNELYVKIRNDIWEYCKINNIDSTIREDILKILQLQLKNYLNNRRKQNESR